jgi:hypothetical protein
MSVVYGGYKKRFFKEIVERMKLVKELLSYLLYLILQFLGPPGHAGVTPAGQRMVPSGPMSVADAMAIRNSPAGLHHPAQFTAGVAPGMQVEAHRAALQASPHVPMSGAMERMYLNQRMMGNDRADLAALYNNPAFIARQQQYPAAAMQQAMYDMQNWQQQMRRDQSFGGESAERQNKVSTHKDFLAYQGPLFEWRSTLSAVNIFEELYIYIYYMCLVIVGRSLTLNV